MSSSFLIQSRPEPGRPFGLRWYVALLGLVIAALPPTVQAATERQTSGLSLTVSHSVARVGQSITLTGRVPATTARTVVLERRTRSGWTRITRASTTATGTFRFVTTTRAEPTHFRVRAPRARQNGHVTGPAVTPTRTVTPLLAPGSTSDAATTNVATNATASSFIPGQEPGRVLAADPGTAAGWRSSGEGVGAWLQVGWDGARVVRRVVVQRDPLDQPGILSGYLSFDDGSAVQVVLSSTARTTVLPFAARSVSRVRFTVTSVSPGASAVGLTSFRVEAAPSLSAADVATSAPADGDVAGEAVATSSSGNPAALVDGGVAGVGTTWTTAAPSGSWVRLAWTSPRELTTIAIAGAPSGSVVKSATVEFSDGAKLTLGAVSKDPARPTVLSFMPRVTRWVTVTIDSVGGSGALTLSELTTLQRGAASLGTPGGVEAPYVERPVDCSSTARPSDTVGLLVRCPTNGAEVGDTSTVAVVTGPSFTRVSATVWPAQGAAAPSSTTVRAVDDAGLATFHLDLTAVPEGPLTVSLVATSPTRTRKAFLGLYRTGSGGHPDPVSDASWPVPGRSLVWSEEFDRPLALTRSGAGADYATSKPEYWGPNDFGGAIFADPASGFGNVRVVEDRYLKISTQPKPEGFSDFMKWNRTRVGGILASARPGGSGFSAQFGYFETRMLLPAGTGTWPAFWMLPSRNLIANQPTSAEIDALEHYGHNPAGTCHTSHQYPNTDKLGVAHCAQNLGTEREALVWHTFGVAVDPTVIRYFIDGRQVATAPQVPNGVDPMFWMVNLSLGGGWPIELGPTQDRTDLYVDYVRVYV